MWDEIDEDLLRNLQYEEFDSNPPGQNGEEKKKKKVKTDQNVTGAKSGQISVATVQGMSLIDPEWEVLDPTPDIHALFLQFDTRFFEDRLVGVEVRWSPRMTLCAGLCSYEGRGGLCSIRLSVPLLKLRPRKDLIETLLHEMIHAYLFVTQSNRDRDGHGPEFQKHMHRINAESGTKITIYHSFHDEVRSYKQHWWRCQGQCQHRPPYYGWVKRAMNRVPGPNDFWWKDHQLTCGGEYIKVKEPEKPEKPSKQSKTTTSTSKKTDEGADIRKFFTPSPKKKKASTKSEDVEEIPPKSSSTGQGRPPSTVIPFDGRGHTLGGSETATKRSRLLDLWPASQIPSKHIRLGVDTEKPSSSSSVEGRSQLAALASSIFSPTPSSSSSSSFSSTNETSLQSEPTLVSCPVCCKQLPLTDINEHLNLCLS